MDGVKATYTPICHHIGVHHSHCGVATTQCCSNSNSLIFEAERIGQVGLH